MPEITLSPGCISWRCKECDRIVLLKADNGQNKGTCKCGIVYVSAKE
jgi:hypothetical protein